MPLTRIADLQNEAEAADIVDRVSQLSQLYDDFVESDPGDGHRRAPGIHASEIAGCPRKIVYNILDTPKVGSISKNWRQRFQFGKAVHAMIQTDFREMARKSNGRIQFEDEVPISPKLQALAARLNIYSACDGVFTFRDDPLGSAYATVGLEIKTEAPDGYAKLQAPKPDHIDQAHVYMACLDLPLMYFMYVNKGNQNNTPSISPFLIKFDRNRWDKLEAKCLVALQMAKEGVLPDRQEGIQCEFCPYSHTCQPNYGASKAFPRSASWKQPRRSI